MKTTRIAWLGGILLLMAASVVRADPAGTGADEPDSSAVEAPRVGADLSGIRERAGAMPIDTRRDIDKRIEAMVKRVNGDVLVTGQTKVAAKLASEFGLTSDALLELKGDYGFSWGELVVAHTLLVDSDVKVDLLDLESFRLDGLSWGAIAYGLRFHMEDLEEKIKAEGRIATGLSKTNGPASAGR